MGEIEVNQVARDGVLDSPDCPSLRRAVFEPGFGTSGAIGVEIEFFVFERGQHASLGMAGSGLAPGDFMARLADVAGERGQLVRDPLNGYPTGLALDHAGKFCLENGGQVEYASSTCPNLDAVADELQAALVMCEQAARGELGFLSHGTHPTLEARIDPLVPNSRYRIMERFFAPDSIHRWGNYTSSIQVNLDVPEAEDWPGVLQLAFALSRFAYPLFANSRYLYAEPFAGESARTSLLAQVDPTRQQVPSEVLLAPDPVEGYVQWALDASVIFAGDLALDELPRRGELSFRDWIVDGYRGQRPGLAHWVLHLGTLWPDVRPRRFIELRATDAQPFEHVMAAVAFWQALIQRPEGRRALGAFFARLPGAETSQGPNPALANVLMREAGDPLFRDPMLLELLLALAAGVLERAGEAHWAEAIAHLASRREFGATGVSLPTAADFVAQARCDDPARAFGCLQSGTAPA